MAVLNFLGQRALFPWLVFLGLVLPRLLRPGMFLDGVTYAALAKNLADGKGSFNAPFYTPTLYTEFYEQPPLGLWLESLWFRLLDSTGSEAVFSLLCGLLSILLIGKLWKKAVPGFREHTWLVQLAWVLIPIVSWSYGNNMLENMAVLVLMGALILMIDGRWKGDLLAGGLIVAAFFIKGPAVLYVLAFPFFQAMAGGSWLRVVFLPLAVILWALLYFGITGNWSSFVLYMQSQFLPALQGTREVAGSRLYLLPLLLGDILLPGIVLLIIRKLSGGRRPRYGRRENWLRSLGLVWFAAALSGTLPLFLSAKQAHWYLMPAMPAWAMAVSLACLYWLPDRKSKNQSGEVTRQVLSAKQFWPYLNGLGLAGLLGIVLFLPRTPLRGKSFHRYLLPALESQMEKAKNAQQKEGVVPEQQAAASLVPVLDQAVQVCPSRKVQDWYLVANLARYGRIGLTSKKRPVRMLVLRKPKPGFRKRAAKQCRISDNCQLLNQDLGLAAKSPYLFYRCAD
jgi:hypothetical protein